MTKTKPTLWITLTIIFAAIMLLGSVFALIIATRTITNIATIRTVGVSVWQDDDCTISLSSWMWGSLEPGGSVLKTMYIKNDGNTIVTMSMTTDAWLPANSANYITLTWTAEETVIAVNSIIEANVIMTISSSIVGTGITDFTFNLIVTGSSDGLLF